MAKEKIVKIKKQAIDMYFSATDEERMEMLRFKNEVDALKKLFVKVDFKKLEQEELQRQYNVNMFEKIIEIDKA